MSAMSTTRSATTSATGPRLRFFGGAVPPPAIAGATEVRAIATVWSAVTAATAAVAGPPTGRWPREKRIRSVRSWSAVW